MTTIMLQRVAATMHELGFRGVAVDTARGATNDGRGIHVGGYFFTTKELDESRNLALLLNGRFAEILLARKNPPPPG